MIRVTAPSRLHFGLFYAGAIEPRGESGQPARRFGGAGLMIEAPGTVVAIQPASAWSAVGPLADRAIEFARRFVATLSDALEPQAIVVEKSPPEHAGLGAGTQLGLAVARALAIAARHSDWHAVELGIRVGRGVRSAVGIHGFQHGGLIVEAGKLAEDLAAPLVVQAMIPASWRILLVRPTDGQGIHGSEERQAFHALESDREKWTDKQCRLILLGLLPALRAGDIRAFGEALHEFNACAGEPFVAAQGGRYASPAAAEIIAWFREHGFPGVGQSSWGPTIFAVVEDEAHAVAMKDSAERRFSGKAKVEVTTASAGHCVDRRGSSSISSVSR